jgi:hypothetical protein
MCTGFPLPDIHSYLLLSQVISLAWNGVNFHQQQNETTFLALELEKVLSFSTRTQTGQDELPQDH